MLLEISGKKNKMKTAIIGNTIPIKNHLLNDLPILRAKKAVMSGMLNNPVSPSKPIATTPILRNIKNYCIYYLVTLSTYSLVSVMILSLSPIETNTGT